MAGCLMALLLSSYRASEYVVPARWLEDASLRCAGMGLVAGGMRGLAESPGLVLERAGLLLLQAAAAAAEAAALAQSCAASEFALGNW